MRDPPPAILFVSENLQLGGLTAISLGRLHASGKIRLKAIWSKAPGRARPPLGAAEHNALLAARDLSFPEGDHKHALFGSVFIPDYATLAREIGVPCQAVARMNAPAVAAGIKALGIELGIVCGHSQIFHEATLLAPRRGWINAHPSLLPMHRGPLPGT